VKKKELKSLRTKKKDELKKMLEKIKKEAGEVLVKIKLGQEKNLKKYKNLRKDMAQILTIIREKEIVEEEMKLEKKEAEK
jgi:ribosomal protein L29